MKNVNIETVKCVKYEWLWMVDVDGYAFSVLVNPKRVKN